MSNRTDRTGVELQRCALELFLRDGYDATTMAAIAQAAGVSNMTLFRHPALPARMRESSQRTERAVVDTVLAGGIPWLQALVAAAACLGAPTAALPDWPSDDAARSLCERITAALDQLRPDDRA